MSFFGSMGANFKSNLAAATRRVDRQRVLQTSNGVQVAKFGEHTVNTAIEPSNLRTLLTTKKNPSALYPHDLVPQFPLANLLKHGTWSVRGDNLVMAEGAGRFNAAKGHHVAVQSAHADLISASFLPQTPHEQVSVLVASKRFSNEELVAKIKGAADNVRLSDPEFKVARQGLTQGINTQLLSLPDERFGEPRLSINFVGQTAHVESPNARFLAFLAQSLDISLQPQARRSTWAAPTS